MELIVYGWQTCGVCDRLTAMLLPTESSAPVSAGIQFAPDGIAASSIFHQTDVITFPGLETHLPSNRQGYEFRQAATAAN
jgi:hypothetical protein